MNNLEFKFYKLYGLTVKSNINLHNALIHTNSYNYDVDISIGRITNDTSIFNHNLGNFKFSKNHFIFSIDNVASYEITDGNKILIEPELNSNWDEIRKFTLGSALGLLLFQRNIVALHGGAISINDNGIIISGNIGAGKTSTIAALINNGHCFLSDDISSITKNSNLDYVVNSCVPQQKLCKDTAITYGYNTDNLLLIDSAKDKYLRDNIENFHSGSKKLKTIFYLDIGDSDSDVFFEEVRGIDKLNIIIGNIFRKEYIPNNLISNIFIKECLNIAKCTAIYKIVRPQGKNSIEKIVSIIENISSKY